MLKKVTRNVIKGETGKELEKLMGGRVLELPSERAYKQGLNEGKSKWLHEGEKKGFLDTLISLVNENLLNFDVAAEKAQAEGVNKDEFLKMLKESSSAQN